MSGISTAFRTQSVEGLIDVAGGETGAATSRAYIPLRVLLGLILCAAALAKGYALGTGPVEHFGLVRSRAALIVLTELELGLGIALIAGLLPRLVHGLTLASFAAFALLALAEAWAGKASCGCFGRITVHPWMTFAIDVAAVVALLLVRPVNRHPAQRHRAALAGSAILAIGIPGGVWAATAASSGVAESADLETVGNLVILEPEKWGGKALPILSHVSVGEELHRGRWLLALYHHDCADCREAIPRLADLAPRLAPPTRVALVAVPPIAPAGRDLIAPSAHYLSARLDANRQWFVQTPAVMFVQDGVVKAVGEEAALVEARAHGPS